MIAARVAAQLSRDPNLEVRREKGGLGELRVAVDGLDVVDSSRFWYPTPSSVLAKIHTHLESSVPFD